MSAIISSTTPDAPLQSRIVDDKSPICIPFILDRLAAWRKEQEEKLQQQEDGAGEPRRPFIIGLNGVQGVGKTTLVRALAETLQQREMLRTLVVSIDDFYLTHSAQLVLAEAHPDNSLVQYRGEPGTHDIDLLTTFFAAIRQGRPTKVPQYDKAAFNGLGDRVPESQWRIVNESPDSTIQVVLIEGWCVGFRALPEAEVEARWRRGAGMSGGRTTLHMHKLEHLQLVNANLRHYDAAVTDLLDAFVHVDAEDLSCVYGWRLEQEAQLRRERGGGSAGGAGAGMTDEQVVRFVDAYFPAYELFSDGVRAGVLLPSRPGFQLRLVVDKDRRVKESIVL